MPNKSYLSFPSVRLFSLLEIVNTFDTVYLKTWCSNIDTLLAFWHCLFKPKWQFCSHLIEKVPFSLVLFPFRL